MSSVEPSLVAVGVDSIVVTVRGERFVPGSQVLIDGQEDATTRYHGPSELEVILRPSTTSTTGSRVFRVRNPPPGGGQSDPRFLRIESVPDPGAPQITRIDPGWVFEGSPASSIEIRGWLFSPTSRVLWNGSERAATFVDDTRILVSLDASDLATPKTAAVQVVGAAPAGTVHAVGFPVISRSPTAHSTITVPVEVTDLKGDPTRDVVYASWVDTVAALDAATGAMIWATEVIGTPNILELNDDRTHLYVAFPNLPRITRLALPSGAIDRQITLGDPPDDRLRVQDMARVAGRPQSMAVSVGTTGYSLPAGVAVHVYDEGVLRPQLWQGDPGTDQIEPSSWSSRIYGTWNDEEFRRILLSGEGSVTDVGDAGALVRSGRITWNAGLIFTNRGRVFEPEAMILLGNVPRYGTMVPDVRNGRVFWYADDTLLVAHYLGGTVFGTVAVPEASGTTRLVRFGRDGLAMGGGPNLVFLRSALVAP